MESSIWLFICSLLLSTTTGSHNYYVKSDTSDPCPQDLPCETLDVYVSNESAYFTENTSFIFLPGTHTLNSTVSIHNVTNVALVGNADLNEGNVTIQCNGSGGLVFQHASRVKLVNLSFVSCGQSLPDSLQRDGETAQAALAFGEVSDLLLDSVSVSHSTGYGVLGHCVHGNFEIVYCLFDSNKGNTQHLGGNAAIEYTNCSQPGNGNGTSLVNISSSNFTNGDYEGYNYTEHTYSGTLATGLMMILSQTNITVLITDVLMEGNRNNIHPQGFGGNLFVHFLSSTMFLSNNVTIRNSKLINGTGWLGGGVGVSVATMTTTVNMTREECSSKFRIIDTYISNNSGIMGSGLFYEYQMHGKSCPYVEMTLHNCSFDGNTLKVYKTPFKFTGNGVAVHLIAKFYRNMVIGKLLNHYKTHFHNCTFSNSRLESRTDAKLSLTTTTLRSINMYSSLNNCKVLNNEFPGIGLSNSIVTMMGNITIKNNTGLNGGGMSLCESSYMILTRNASISFINNHAAQSGGGIYIESSCLHTKPFCFYQPYNELNCFDLSAAVNIFMINNTAGYAGDQIYGGTLDNCKVLDCDSTEMFQSLFMITPNNSETEFSAVTSSPSKICFCSESKPDCSYQTITLHEAKYPGETIYVDVASAGQFDGTVPGTIVYQTQDTASKPRFYTTGTKCAKIAIRIKTERRTQVNVSLQLTSEIHQNSSDLRISESIIVSVPLKPCPYGFNHSKGICVCEDTLKEKGIHCTINSSGIITRHPPAWIGYSNDSSGLIYNHVCPYNYCIDDQVDITSDTNTFDQDSQCAPNRTGILCSQCQDGFGLSVGTSDCLTCNTKLALPLSLVVYITLGILLVLLLVFFNITFTDGICSGLLFYGNIVNLNNSIFIPPRNFNPVFVVTLSWMSLNPGINLCFYEGMDAYAKAWFDFCFPSYLFLIAASIIILCEKSTRIATLFGEDIIKVLATLFIVSYTHLIQSVVTVLSATHINYPSNITSSGQVSKLVWLSDPSQEYFSGKHIPLALVAIVFGLLILAYTLVLLFVQPLQRYSHLRCFSWMAKLKPLIDAYTAPHIIKDKCRYWEGLLLLFRLILAITLAVRNKVSYNLTAITLICVTLLTIAWCVGGIYKKPHLNLLNSSYILNLALTSIVLKISTQRHILYISFSIAIATMAAVLVYHAYLQAKKKNWCRRRRYEELPSDNDDNTNLRPF